MGRLLAFLLGGAALALYAPHLFLTGESLGKWTRWWIDTLGGDWYAKIFTFGPGIFAGLALILVAIRGKD